MKSPGKHVLIYRLGSLGDTVIALPCFHKIRESFPGADITLLTNKPVLSKAAAIEAVLGNKYFFNRVLNYPVGTRNFKLLITLVLQIRSNKIDTVINLTASRSKFTAFRDKCFFLLAGVKHSIGFPDEKEDYEIVIDENTGMHEWEAKRLSRRIKVLGEINLELEQYWNLHLDQEEVLSAENALESFEPGSRLLAISTGTKCQSNDWGSDNWMNLLKKLSFLLPRWKLVVLGASDEETAAQACLSAWKNGGISLCGKTLPRVSAAVLKRVNLFIGHDSGPMHLAACVGTPCVGIFSARNFPGQWFPRGQNNSILYHHVDCAGCGLEICIEQKKKCILSISAEEVKLAVQEIIVQERAKLFFDKLL